ncbi:NUDIX hydrolase [Polynucleobacter necessarius]|uniref:NUDIX hydrolase n=1 Tax=Polynucleobacter necessarius TaxID=576610 RepID=UPI000E092FAF|nr:NUDIX hydrolase [Polynucleobacter necessarius]
MKIINLNKGSSGAPFSEKIYSILTCKNPFGRSNEFGHITASGLVINAENKALLIFHPYIKQWIQPGGHIDDGESPVEAAIREVYEETGLVCILDEDCLDPIDIDIHEIPANSEKGESAHLHIDLLYRLRIIKEEAALENIECRWFSYEDIRNLRLKRFLSKTF